MDSIKIEINNIHLLLIYLIFVPPTPLCGGGGKSAVLCSVVSAVCGCLAGVSGGRLLALITLTSNIPNT